MNTENTNPSTQNGKTDTGASSPAETAQPVNTDSSLHVDPATPDPEPAQPVNTDLSPSAEQPLAEPQGITPTPTDQPAITPAEQPTTPTDQPAITPAEQPAITPAEQPAITPAEQPATPAEQPATTPQDTTTQAKPEAPVRPLGANKEDEKAPAGAFMETLKKHLAFLLKNKGVIIGAVIALIALIFLIVSLSEMGNSDQYQGMINKVKQETESLKNDQ